ncbi:MAG: glycosyltransferase family 9 protein [Bacteroidota bacterium]|nr:glycosyltransferase family 9 protein [Bacteroidota bacterium]
MANKFFFKNNKAIEIKRILIIKLDEIGDMATSTHVFESLKKSYPNAHISVLCKSFVKTMLQYDPYIDELITEKETNYSSYQLIVELRGNWNTLLKSILSKAQIRLSRAEVRFKNKGNQLHEVETNFEIIKPVLDKNILVTKPKLYFSDKENHVVDDFLKVNNINKYAIFHIGARKKLRQWPIDRFALIADFMFQKNISVVFVGTKDDEEEIMKARELMKCQSYSFTSHPDLSVLSALCSKAFFYIGNESGPLHVAACFDVPIIGLYGPGVPNVFYPYSKNAHVLHHVLKCNPCDQIHCVEPNNICINRIEVVDVMNLIESLLV